MIGNILINGLLTGGMYATLALGFALVFSVGRIVNMAHTALYMVGAYLFFSGVRLFGINVWISFALAIVLAVLVGVAVFKLFIDRIKEHETAVMIITVALAMLFQEICLEVFGGRFRAVDPFIAGSVEVFGTTVTYQNFIAIGSSALALIAVWFVLKKTKIGFAIRAIAEDGEIANVMGIDGSRMQLLVIVMSVGLAGLAGATTAPITMVSPQMWMGPLVVVLAAVVIGGLGSIGGSVLGAFILGYAEILVVFLVPNGSFLRGVVSLGLMILVLLIKPEGLFGVTFEEERL